MIGVCEECGKKKILVKATVWDIDSDGNKSFPDKYICRDCVYEHFTSVVQFIAIL
jgi:hypothetical protein